MEILVTPAKDHKSPQIYEILEIRILTVRNIGKDIRQKEI